MALKVLQHCFVGVNIADSDWIKDNLRGFKLSLFSQSWMISTFLTIMSETISSKPYNTATCFQSVFNLRF